MRTGSGETCVKDEFRHRHMVAHIVGRSMSYYQIGVGVADDLYRPVSLLHIVTVGKKISDVSVDDLDARKRACFFRFRGSDLPQFVGHYDLMPHVSVAKMANGHVIASLNTSDQRSDAVYLNVVGMTSDCKYIHNLTFHTCFCRSIRLYLKPTYRI